VAGVRADRELPVVWAVCKGSFLNKLMLVPAAMLISALAPWAITPLLMVGGAFLCFEGFEKVAHKWLHSPDQAATERAELIRALADPAVDLVQVEKDKIKGAVRTDFILSAEIIAITLGTVQASPFMTQLTVLSGIAIVMTLGVYGLVGLIVKLDDGGLYLSQQAGDSLFSRFQRSMGRGVLVAAPYLMKGLSIAGTMAMFLVGGGILTHSVPAAHHWIESLTQAGGLAFQPVLALGFDAFVGVLAGAVVLAGVTLVQRFRAPA
jgi:predicted DNA repair protein MutK